MTESASVTAERVHVVAGILRNARGRVLLAQRPPGKDLAGLWEFPGGKVEPGETAPDALVRELGEELGIRAQIGRRRIAVPHGRIVLDVHEVNAYEGTPSAREHQRLAWIEPDRINHLWVPAADRPVITSLRLPERYLITPAPVAGEETAFLECLKTALRRGINMIQLRLPGWSRAETVGLARRVRDLCHADGARVLLNADFELAGVLGLDGVHLPYRIAHALRQRPLPGNRLVGVSCHDADELAHAATIGADFATLSPLNSTTTHAQSIPLGWTRAALLLAEVAFPVYALGGLDGNDQRTAQEHGFQGIAAIRSLWP